MTRARLWLALAVSGFTVRVEGFHLFVRPANRITPRLSAAIRLHRDWLIRFAAGELPESCGACGRPAADWPAVNGVAVTRCAPCQEGWPLMSDWLAAMGLRCTT